MDKLFDLCSGEELKNAADAIEEARKGFNYGNR